MEIRRSYDRLISTVGFPILVRWYLYIGSGPWRYSTSVHMVERHHSCNWNILSNHDVFWSWLYVFCYRWVPISITPVNIIIPSAQRSCWGGILVSLRPSVRLSVRPSVPHAVSALYHLQLWMDSFHIRHKWSLPWEGVSRTMTFDLDLYLQGRSALT